MSKAITYLAAAAIGGTIGYFGTRAILKHTPDTFSIHLPFGGKITARRRTK